MVQTKHGHRPWGKPASPTYKSWHSMKQRATNPNANRSDCYLGRGIAVCERWKTFANFLEDMGERPPGTNLDRIDNDGGYEPGNCRWATQAQQMRNRRNNVFFEHGGRRMILNDWSRETGIPLTTLRTRIKAGWPAERVLSTQRFAKNQFTTTEI